MFAIRYWLAYQIVKFRIVNLEFGQSFFETFSVDFKIYNSRFYVIPPPTNCDKLHILISIQAYMRGYMVMVINLNFSTFFSDFAVYDIKKKF